MSTFITPLFRFGEISESANSWIIMKFILCKKKIILHINMSLVGNTEPPKSLQFCLISLHDAWVYWKFFSSPVVPLSYLFKQHFIKVT